MGSSGVSRVACCHCSSTATRTHTPTRERTHTFGRDESKNSYTLLPRLHKEVISEWFRGNGVLRRHLGGRSMRESPGELAPERSRARALASYPDGHYTAKDEGLPPDPEHSLTAAELH